MITFDVLVGRKKVITITDNMVIKALRAKIVEDLKVDPRDVSIITTVEQKRVPLKPEDYFSTKDLSEEADN